MLKYSVIGLLILSLAGCSTKTATEASNHIDKNQSFTEEAIANSKKITTTNVIIHNEDGVYVGGEQFELTANDNLPSFFNRNIIINQPSKIPYSSLMFSIAKTAGVDIIITSDAMDFLSGNIEAEEDPGSEDSTSNDVGGNNDVRTTGEPDVSFHFTGTLEEALDKLSNRVSLFWEFDGRQVVVFRTKTETYILDALPSSTSFTASTSNTGSSSGNTGESNASSSSSTQSVTTSTETGNIWPTIDKTITQFLSPQGKISTNPSLGSITITDTPIVHYNVSRYIKNYNQLLGKRIAIHTAIYQVSLNDSNSQGIDWNSVFQGNNGTNYAYSTLSQGFGLLDGATSGAFSASKTGGKWNGSQLLLQSLNKVGKTSLTTSSTSITTNGQPVPLSNLNSVHYVSARNVTSSTENSGVSVDIETDVITQGVSMTILPKLMHNNDVLVQIAIDMSVLNALQDFSTGDGGSIQLPDSSNQSFLQNIPMRQGQTLMISGFERSASQTSTNSIIKDFWALGGNKDNTTNRFMTVIFITPYVLAR